MFVNGVTGEGTTLRVDERKRLAEEWLKVSRKHGLTMVLCIGGADIADVYDMCEHAEKIGVDCIVLLPDLFYKPRIEEDLVNYFKDITKYVSRVPLYYYHVPEYTGVKCKFIFYSLSLFVIRKFQIEKQGNTSFLNLVLFQNSVHATFL